MKLREWLDKHDISALEMGRRIGLKEPNSIYRWLRGELKPSDANMVAVIRETKGEVSANDFLDLGEAA